jgi:uncharacterized DUF497 family protein
MKVAGFDWDLGNRAKCAKHGVTVAEIEGLFRGPVSVFPDPAHSTTEERFKAIGRTEAGRMGVRGVHPQNAARANAHPAY